MDKKEGKTKQNKKRNKIIPKTNKWKELRKWKENNYEVPKTENKRKREKRKRQKKVKVIKIRKKYRKK